MRAWLAALVFAFSINLSVAQNIERASVIYVETPLAKRLAYSWKHCLSMSFHIHRKLTARQDAAANTAFRTCAVEEKKYRDYWSVRLVSDATLARLNTIVKTHLMKGDFDHLHRPN
jgi:hypothetical protein